MMITRPGIQLVVYWSILFVLTGCEDWNLPKIDHFRVVMTDIEARADFLVINSRIEGIQSETVDEYGHVWGLASDPLPTIEDHVGRDNFELLAPSEAGRGFQSSIDILDLQPKARYVFRAYARIDDRFCYSEETLAYQSEPVVIQSAAVRYESGTSATVEGRIFLQQSGIRVIDYGHCWSPSATGGTQTCSGFGQLIAEERRFTSEIIGLQDGQTYTVTPYAVLETAANESDTCFGTPVSFQAMLRQFWQPLDVPEALLAREGAATFTFGDSLACIAGGIDREVQGRTELLNDCWCYASFQGWRRAADLPEPLAYAVAFTLGDRAIVGTGLGLGEDTPSGLSTLPSASFYAYDPAADEWEPVTSLPEPRLFATAFSLGDAGWVVGGLDDNENARAEIWRYEQADDAGRWTLTTTLDSSRYGLASFTIGEAAYLGSGFTETGVPSEKWWRLDDFGTQEVRPLLPLRGFLVGFSGPNGNGYAAMGADPSFDVLRDVQLFDPDEGWQPLTEFPEEGRLFASGFSLQERLFIGLGATPDGIPAADFWVYTP